jgi:hypothetical protein
LKQTSEPSKDEKVEQLQKQIADLQKQLEEVKKEDKSQ